MSRSAPCACGWRSGDPSNPDTPDKRKPSAPRTDGRIIGISHHEWVRSEVAHHATWCVNGSQPGMIDDGLDA